MLAVAVELNVGNTRVEAAPKYSVARGIVARANSRKAADMLADVESVESPFRAGDEILTENFNECTNLQRNSIQLYSL